MRRFHHASMTSEMLAMAAEVSGSKVLVNLCRRNLAVAVIKGPAMARLHPEGWPRPYADIDVLVPPSSFRLAIAEAKNSHFSYSLRAVPQWRWFDYVCREGVNLHSPSGGNLDFHHHLAPWVFSSNLPVEDIIARATPHQMAASQVPFAAPEDLVIASALHILNDLWKGKLGLTSWRDFLVLHQKLGSRQTRAAFARAELGWFFDLLVNELSLVIPEAGLEPNPAPETPLSMQLRLAALGWSRVSSPTRHRLAWAARLPAPNGIAFLIGTAFPSPRYIRDRHGTYRDYWRRSWSETLSTIHGSDFRMTTVEDYKARNPNH